MNQPNIVIVDYGLGNVYSVFSAISSLGYKKITISSNRAEILIADAIILPGVGAFGACIKNLRDLNLDEVLYEAVNIRKKPILGICVGMQLMADFSEEGGGHVGLGLIPGRVVKLNLPPEYTVPHVGWNNCKIIRKIPEFDLLRTDVHFYFDHSYHYQCESQFVVATSNYFQEIIVAIAKDNICGVQFHPEKSQANGLRIFRSFFNLVHEC